MLKLEKYLLENADEAKQSISTNSKYYTFEGVKIRISDHYAIDKDSEMQIILPTNGSPYYTVFLKGSKRCLTWRAKQIIEYIPNFILTKKMMAPIRKDNDDNEANLVPLEKILEGEILQSKVKENLLSPALLKIYNHPKVKWNEHDADTFHFLVNREFGISKRVNGDFRTFLKSTEISYLEAINLYYYVVIKEDLIPTYEKLKDYYNSIFGIRK